jgi:hypothetical protein
MQLNFKKKRKQRLIPVQGKNRSLRLLQKTRGSTALVEKEAICIKSHSRSAGCISPVPTLLQELMRLVNANNVAQQQVSFGLTKQSKTATHLTTWITVVVFVLIAFKILFKIFIPELVVRITFSNAL